MINSKDVEHIAGLARIELSAEEKTKFVSELSSILEFVEKLNEVTTEKVPPTSGGTLLENSLRPDEQIDKDLEGKYSKLLEDVPEKEGLWVKVKSVF